MNPKRKREAFETKWLPTIGKSCNLPCSFEGLREEDARDMLGGTLRWLAGFADQLADNTSFAELLRTSEKEVKRSLAKQPLHFPPVKAVQLATSSPGDYGPPPWPWEAWHSESWSLIDGRLVIRMPDRHVGNDGSENIAIKIRWGYFTNKEIGKEMRKFAHAHRPENEACNEPMRRGQRPKAVIQSHLKALSVLRIRKVCGRNQWKRLKLVAEVCRYKGCVREWAEHQRGGSVGHGDQPMSEDAKVEMSKARSHALRFFRRLFPWEIPSNYQGSHAAEELTAR